MKILKETAIFIFGMSYFMLVSIPIASIIYLTAHTYFEIKRLIWKR
jgi:hypothetical protein